MPKGEKENNGNPLKKKIVTLAKLIYSNFYRILLTSR